MWIFCQHAFLSVVQDKDYPDTLTVRARVKGDIEKLWPLAHVRKTANNADYLYRATMSRQRVIAAIAKAIEGIDYQSFKDNIEDHDRRSYWYLGVWAEMRGMQDALAREGEA